MERKPPLVDERFNRGERDAIESIEGASMTGKDYLFLPGNARFVDVGLLLLRCATGVFLIYQSHDNVFSAARMGEFEKFLAQFGFPAPELLAPLSVYFQFAAGIGFILGVWTLHWPDPFPTWWPALVLVFLGLYFGLRGSGRYGLDAIIERDAAIERR